MPRDHFGFAEVQHGKALPCAGDESPMIDEYHGTRSIPSNYLRTSLMMRKWFDEFDPGNGDTDTSESGIEP